MTHDTEPLSKQYEAELKRMMEDEMPLAVVEIPSLAAVALICQIQLAARHPENNGFFRDTAINIVRELQNCFNPDSATAKVLEMGWNPIFDGQIDPPSSF